MFKLSLKNSIAWWCQYCYWFIFGTKKQKNFLVDEFKYGIKFLILKI